MKTLIQIKSGFGVLLLTLMLAACGSSGGGGDDDDDEPLVYEGKTSKATIDVGNARELTRSVAAVYTIVGSAAIELKSQQGSEPGPTNYLRLVFDRIAALRNHQIADAIDAAVGARGARRTAVDETSSCGKGRLRVSGFIESSDSTGVLTLEFTNCRIDGALLNGKVVVRIFEYDVNNNIEARVSLTFNNLSVKNNAETFKVSGSVSYSIDALANRQRETIKDLVVLDTGSGRMLRIVDLVSIFTFNDITIQQQATIDIRRGRIFDSRYGYVDIEATSLVGYTNISWEFPDSGVYDLVARGRIKATAIDRFQLQLQVDTDNNLVNGYEFDQTLLWLDL